MKLGIVGLPNVGKSTLFNSLTKAGAESANYPFCTIDPNVGIVAVPDERLKLLGDMYHSKKVTPAVIEFVDIAGLVKGCLLYTSSPCNAFQWGYSEMQIKRCSFLYALWNICHCRSVPVLCFINAAAFNGNGGSPVVYRSGICKYF